MLKPGDAAPPFALPDETGRTVRLEDFAGRWVVLYFYPADHTPFCTLEAQAFRDRHAEFVRAGAVVLGVSRDDPATHAQFRRACKLPFSLLADPEAVTLREYEAIGMFGHPKRITYVIDPEGAVAGVYETQVRPQNHVVRALEIILGGDADAKPPADAEPEIDEAPARGARRASKPAARRSSAR